MSNRCTSRARQLSSAGSLRCRTSGAKQRRGFAMYGRILQLRYPALNHRKRRRRIPFDFQRTSLVGLALDSATSSGLGRAPRSAMQDPIQAPPGATRQAGLYTS
ncbi:hypothetical protein TNCV_3677921 [Trichonephila clavipes]|nr:hypothetical protein TNCV_3677921 [Trichonephila clavipes]